MCSFTGSSAYFFQFSEQNLGNIFLVVDEMGLAGKGIETSVVLVYAKLYSASFDCLFTFIKFIRS